MSQSELVLVVLTSSMAGHGFSYAAGELLNVSPETAERWFAHGVARPGEEQITRIQTYVEPQHVDIETEAAQRETKKPEGGRKKPKGETKPAEVETASGGDHDDDAGELADA